MTCPVCGEVTTVTESRRDCECVYRRRRCTVCGHKFYTTEEESTGDALKALEAEIRERRRNEKAKTEDKKIMDEKQARIICALAHADMNVSKAAVYVRFHRNNLEYHIQGIREKTGLDPKRFFDLYKLYTIAVDTLGGDPF